MNKTKPSFKTVRAGGRRDISIFDRIKSYTGTITGINHEPLNKTHVLGMAITEVVSLDDKVLIEESELIVTCRKIPEGLKKNDRVRVTGFIQEMDFIGERCLIVMKALPFGVTKIR